METNGICNKIKYVCDYGAIGDGVANDREAIQAALDDGDGVVVLMKKHYLGTGQYAKLDNRNSNHLTYFGEGKSELIGTSNTRKIDNYANLKITNIKSDGGGFLLLWKEYYDYLEISNCEINNNTIRPIVYIVDKNNPVVTNIRISNNSFRNSRIAILDRITSESIVFSHNRVENFQGYVLRIQFNNALSNVKKIVFDHNFVDGNMTDSKNVRVLQALAKESIHYTNNVIKNLSFFEGEFSLFYSSQGSVFMSNNHFENIISNYQHLIQDKGHASSIWSIHDNVFDQRRVDDPNPVERGNASIINIANNTSIISNNIFLNPRTNSIVLGNSAFKKSGDPFPKNCLISNNSFISTENHSIITIMQSAQDITIQGNKIDKLSNPLGKLGNKESAPRFIAVMNTINDGFIYNITISDNVLNGIDKDGTLLWSYSLDVAIGIKSVKFLRNYMDSGEALIRFRVNPIASGEIIFNVLPAGMTDLFVGGSSAPTGFRISNNAMS